MKSITKKILAFAVAGSFCLSAGALAACGKDSGDGKSAYEIAVDNGFEGTEQEWLDSLKTTVKDTDIQYSVGSDGKTVATITITMSDDTQTQKQITLPKRVVSASLAYGSAIWTAAEATAKSNLAGVQWEVVYDDGSVGALPASKSQIINARPYYNSSSGDAPTWDGSFVDGKVYWITYCFTANWKTTSDSWIYINNDIAALEDYATDDDLDLTIGNDVIQKGETVGVETMSLYRSYNLGEKLQTAYDGYYGESYFYRYTAVTDSMLDGTIDTSTTGYKPVTVNYNQKKYRDSVEVYDPSVTTVKYIDFKDRELPSSLTLTQGDNITTAAQVFVDQEAEARHFVYINGTQEEDFTVTAAMIDTSGVNTSTPGTYAINITYKGYVEKIPVMVNPDMSTANRTKTLTGTGGTILNLLTRHSVTKVDLYDNGYAVAYDRTDPLTQQLGYLGYTLTNDTIEIKYGTEKLAIFKVTGETFAPYEFQTSQLVKTYTGSINMGGPTDTAVTLKTYNNGYGEFTMGEGQTAMTIVVGYTIKDDIITFAPSMAEVSLKIGANDTITVESGGN